MTIAAVVGNSVLWLNQRSYGWKKREVCRDTTHQTHPPLISIISFMCMERHAHGHPNHPPCFLNLSSHVVHSLPTHFHYFHVYVFLCHGHPPFSIPSHPRTPHTHSSHYPQLHLTPKLTNPFTFLHHVPIFQISIKPIIPHLCMATQDISIKPFHNLLPYLSMHLWLMWWVFC